MAEFQVFIAVPFEESYMAWQLIDSRAQRCKPNEHRNAETMNSRLHLLVSGLDTPEEEH